VIVDVKICGLTKPADAALAVAHGAWRLGVVFAGGPRMVSRVVAREIVSAAGDVPVIGVFQSQDVRTILQIAAAAGLRGAQLHGEFPDQAIRDLHAGGLEVWRVATIVPDQPVAGQFSGWVERADVLLVEPRHLDGLGGKGVALSLARAREARLAAGRLRFALAGGLTPDSVGDAIRFVRPDVVDVSSGIESAPGTKEPAKLARFMEQVRDAFPRA
jgi:phosphoribosylanthranilate isomerase